MRLLDAFNEMAERYGFTFEESAAFTRFQLSLFLGRSIDVGFD